MLELNNLDFYITAQEFKLPEVSASQIEVCFKVDGREKEGGEEPGYSDLVAKHPQNGGLLPGHH